MASEGLPRRAARARHYPRCAAIAYIVLAFAWITSASPAAHAESWATTQAAELTRQGRAHSAQGEPLVGVKRFLDAIALDATYGPAYLGLGAAREQSGDVVEADRAYSMGIEHVNAFAAGHVARAHLRKRLGRDKEALADLVAAAEISPDDDAILSDLEGSLVSAQALPAALGIARKRARLATERGDTKTLGEVRIAAKALAALLRELDPVTAGSDARGVVRRAIALAARR
jgi:tetratricopeptide (TPR) repeat protein